MMIWSNFFRGATALGFAVVAAAAALAPVQADTTPQKLECTAPADLTRLEHPLKRVAQRIAGSLPVKIVAIGSSSTAGAGASSPAMNYPSRLEVELQVLFPRIEVSVVNRGVNGEESRDMLARFDRDVFAEHPDLVLWQVGSNSVLRDRPLDQADTALHEGLKRLRKTGMDVVLINPQYAPKVIVKHDVDGMVDLIDLTAKQDQCRSVPALRGDALLAPDGRHAVQCLPVAGRAAHERLELRLHRQAPGWRDPRCRQSLDRHRDRGECCRALGPTPPEARSSHRRSSRRDARARMTAAPYRR